MAMGNLSTWLLNMFQSAQIISENQSKVLNLVQMTLRELKEKWCRVSRRAREMEPQSTIPLKLSKDHEIWTLTQHYM